MFNRQIIFIDEIIHGCCEGTEVMENDPDARSLRDRRFHFIDEIVPNFIYFFSSGVDTESSDGRSGQVSGIGIFENKINRPFSEYIGIGRNIFSDIIFRSAAILDESNELEVIIVTGGRMSTEPDSMNKERKNENSKREADFRIHA